MSRPGWRTPLLCGLALLVAVWVANASPIALMTGSPTNPSDISAEIRHKQLSLGQQRASRHTRFPGLFWFEVIGYVVFALVLLGIVVFLVTAVRSRDRDAREALVEAPDEPEAFSALLVPAALVASAERQLAALREGAPRNAIVACWVALETSCSSTGLSRRSSETSSEFTQRVLSTWVVDRDLVLALAALYREARFSTHDMSEHARSAAVEALEAILASLRSGRPDLVAAGTER